MEYRTLRGTDLDVSRIGLGCNKIAAPMPEEQRRAVEATLRAAIERGINFFDTADIYGDGAADRLLRNAFAGQRDKVVICSKSGFQKSHNTKRWQRAFRKIAGRLTPAGGAARAISRVAAGPTFAPASIEAAIEGSLNRLGTDYLDLFLLHSPSQVVLSRDDLSESLERLKLHGKIRYYGVSFATNSSTDDILAWLEIPGVSAVQVLVNPLKSVDLTRLAPAARAREVGLIARQPFHKGAIFMNQRFLDLAAANPHYTPSQLALQFGLGQDGVDMVLAGFRSLAHLEDNLAALAGPGPSRHEREQLRSLTEIV